MPGDQQARGEATILAGNTYCDYQEQVGLLLYKGDREEELGIQVTHWTCLGTLKGRVKQPQFEKDMVTLSLIHI